MAPMPSRISEKVNVSVEPINNIRFSLIQLPMQRYSFFLNHKAFVSIKKVTLPVPPPAAPDSFPSSQATV